MGRRAQTEFQLLEASTQTSIATPAPEAFHLHSLDYGYVASAFGIKDANWLFNLTLGGVLDSKLYGGLMAYHPFGFFATDASIVEHPQPHDILDNSHAQPRTPCGRKIITIDYRFNSSPNYVLGGIVPQRLWQAKTKAARTRHATNDLRAPIFFVRDDPSGMLGISLREAAEGIPYGSMPLRGGDQRVDMGASSTHIRLVLPGYETWESQIQLREERSGTRAPITLERLAKTVGTKVELFFQEAKRDHSQSDPGEWAIGEIKPEHILIIALVHTSKGGWQPILQACRNT
ncbi:hypothetical protein K488DRAFT_74510 [Vararia minispora EC-137]|uniref:Uncharacterized protein n=1 Tax=Vararia minispora EC-137 TaxID=1314806 RepID=A0ACB8Q762_9AGAM|nr:hypothetical protein K488DRAFT_74510 [Vararia minispora EC-137]